MPEKAGNKVIRYKTVGNVYCFLSWPIINFFGGIDCFSYCCHVSNITMIIRRQLLWKGRNFSLIYMFRKPFSFFHFSLLFLFYNSIPHLISFIQRVWFFAGLTLQRFAVVLLLSALKFSAAASTSFTTLTFTSLTT